MTYYMPDLTGVSPEHQIIGDPFTLFQTGQKVVFEDGPIYRSSLTITVAGNALDELTDPRDYTVEDDDIDYTAMSRMKAYDAGFNKVLLRSITITRALPDELRVTMAYQKLYPVTHKVALRADRQLAWTPELAVDILERLATVEGQVRDVTDVHADSTTVPKLMTVDLTGTNLTNKVARESHTLNTYDGKNVIRPAYGSFYRGSVVLTVPEKQYTLVKDVDYVTFGTNREKTASTEAKDEVCEFILITYSYAGEVEVTYQAYGGAVTVYDLTSVYKLVNNIDRYLTSANFLTESGLANTYVVRQLLTRIEELSSQMRILNTAGGLPSYGDSTNGTGRRWSLRANDTKLHWWPIATLFKVAGSTTVITADRMKFRIQLAAAKLMADVIVAADLEQGKLSVESAGVVQDTGFTLYGPTSVTPVQMPQFRVVYNKTLGPISGAVLQIGLSLPSLTEIIGVEDVSGIESCWIVNPENATHQLPSDTAFTLPDGSSVWDTNNVDSVALTRMLPNKTGYLLWHGGQDTESFDLNDPAGFVITPLMCQLPAHFRIDDVDSLDLEFTDASGVATRVVVPMSGTTPGSRSGLGAFPVKTLWGTPEEGPTRTVAAGLQVLMVQDAAGALTTTLKIAHTLASYQDTALRYAIVKLKEG